MQWLELISLRSSINSSNRGQNLGKELYSVMQSDPNIFCGYIVQDTNYIACWDKDSILGQISKKEICLDFKGVKF